MPRDGCRMQRIPQPLLRGHKPHIICGEEGTGKNGLTIKNEKTKRKRETWDLDFTGLVHLTGKKLKNAIRVAATVTLWSR